MKRLAEIYFAHLVLLTICLASPTSPVKASEKVDSLVKNFQEARELVVAKELKQRRILSGLFVINKKLKKLVTEKSGLEQQRQMLEASTNELSEKISTLEKKAQTQKALLGLRLSAIYKLGGQGVARFLVTSRSSAELERNLKILGMVARKDLNLIKDYSETLRDLDVRRAKLSKRLSKLQNVEAQLATSRSSLVAETELKSKVLDNLRKSQQFQMSRLSQLREETSKLRIHDDALLDLLSGPAFFEQKGKLIPPVQGQIRQDFGIIRKPEHGIVLSHKGIFYALKRGQPVNSVFAGKVSFTGELPGFGKTIIIDHGDHYYSVYSHADEIYVSLGQKIKPREKIAAVGNSSLQFGEGLYFEIRHFSEPNDPKVWMKGTTL